jgi:hypothetical protein
MAKDDTVTTAQAARILGYSEEILCQARVFNCGPRYQIIDGRMRYLRSEVEEFKSKRIPPDMLRYGENYPKRRSQYALDDGGRWRRCHSLGYALCEGMTRYFSGYPCANGHTAMRYSKNDQCTVCAEEERLRDQRCRERIAKLWLRVLKN